jgi:autotransporter-associated beta strand protein
VINCGAATVAVAGGAELIINGGTLVATNSSNVGSASLGLRVVSGSATYLGGLTTTLGSATGDFIGVTGGSLTAASLALGRTGLNYGAQPAAGDTGSGLYINGGDVNITGNLNMGIVSAAQSSVNVRMDGGSLTVGGAVTIGLNNGGRWSVVDVNGGTLTVNDTTTGINVGGPLAGDAELLIRNGTATVGIIGLGYGTVADTVVLNQTGGSLYVGSGGIVQVSPNVTESITLNGGILGAAADWSCTNDMQLGNATIQAADASSMAHNISLSGTLAGANLTKTGTGTLTLSGVNTYNGPTTIIEGVLALVNNGVTLVDGSIGHSTNITISTGAFLDVSGILNGTMPVKPVQVLSGTGTILGTLDSTTGGTVSPGGGIDGVPGVLTVTNQVKLGGKTWMKLDRDITPSNDEIVSVANSITAGGALIVTNLGSALVAGDTFQLFSTNVTGAFTSTNLPTVDLVNNLVYTWTNKLAINGTIKVLTVAPNVNLTPTNITTSLSGNVLTLSWPLDHTGWRLLMQTNNLANGVSANTNDWFALPGSASINSTNITIDPTKPDEFYRLVYP